MTERLAKYATIAGVSGGFFQLRHGGKGQVRTPLGNMPIAVVGAALGVGSSIASDLLNQFLLPHISEDKRLKTIESVALHTGASGVGYITVSNVVNKQLALDASGSLRNQFIEGSLINIVSEYLFTQVVKPVVLGKTADEAF